jgi:lipopolysaccharide transport system ATP-binding protein
MPPVIRVENLSKSYRIQHGAARSEYRTLRESLVGAATWPLRKLRAQANGSVEEFWALKDVNLEVQQGEVVGIIGRNGAGKSTLLKVLSRITAPTTGGVELRGRVGSLLEVGTGFHPELTGRENVYLNGSILGMKRREIQRKFDEIVDFSGVEKFLDTPVKRYSSGMYVRLAFAVAAHLEPEILIVDEVLAVGDAEFQKKCLGKMGDVAKSGRTVLFVSHNMAAVVRLCSRGVLMQQGEIAEEGDPVRVTHQYLSRGTTTWAKRVWSSTDTGPGDAGVRLRSARVRDEDGTVADTFAIQKAVYVDVEYLQLEPALRPTAILHFVNEDGLCLFATNDFTNLAWWNTPRHRGVVTATCRIPGNFLAEGRVLIHVALGSYNPNIVHALERDALCFDVIDQSHGDGVRGVHVGHWPGVVRPSLEWVVDAKIITE